VAPAIEQGARQAAGQPARGRPPEGWKGLPGASQGRTLAEEPHRFLGRFDQGARQACPDLQKGSSKIIKIGGQNAFFYSYIRKTKGTVHAVVLVPNGKQSYVMNTVSQGGSEDVARQVARIILSFKT
jgi:hypothetical protein